jgi:hypothetical protein
MSRVGPDAQFSSAALFPEPEKCPEGVLYCPGDGQDNQVSDEEVQQRDQGHADCACGEDCDARSCIARFGAETHSDTTRQCDKRQG